MQKLQGQDINTNDAVEQAALLVERLRLSIPAIVLLEACKPLYSLVAHAGILVADGEGVLKHPFSQFFTSRDSAERLIRRLEAGAAR